MASRDVIRGRPATTSRAHHTVAAELHISANWTAVAKFDGTFGTGGQTHGGAGILKYSW